MQHATSPRLRSCQTLATTLAAAAFAILAGACNEVETGDNGLIGFVPDDCGQVGCDLDDGLAVDATTDVYLDGTDGSSADGLYIRSSKPWIAEVVASDDGGFSPRVTIIGNSPGTTDLLAIDGDGYVVDYTTIEVKAADALEISVLGANVDGPHAAQDTDDLYFVPADTAVQIDTTQLADGSPLMGKGAYSIVINASLAAGVDAGDSLEDGAFRVTVPAGEHDLLITTPTATRRLHFSAR